MSLAKLQPKSQPILIPSHLLTEKIHMVPEIRKTVAATTNDTPSVANNGRPCLGRARHVPKLCVKF